MSFSSSTYYVYMIYGHADLFSDSSVAQLLAINAKPIHFSQDLILVLAISPYSPPPSPDHGITQHIATYTTLDALKPSQELKKEVPPGWRRVGPIRDQPRIQGRPLERTSHLLSDPPNITSLLFTVSLSRAHISQWWRAHTGPGLPHVSIPALG